jgi:hypothetical protein
MKKFIKIDYEMNFSSMCDTESEVMESCGYDINEMSFEDFLEEVKGEYEIIEVIGDLRWLQED